jgi:hypothetical protein
MSIFDNDTAGEECELCGRTVNQEVDAEECEEGMCPYASFNNEDIYVPLNFHK